MSSTMVPLAGSESTESGPVTSILSPPPAPLHSDDVNEIGRNEPPSQEHEQCQNTTSYHQYFAVRRGINNLQNCIFLSWDDCRHHLNDSSHYAQCDSLAQAELYLKQATTLPVERISTTTAPTDITMDSSTGSVMGHDCQVEARSGPFQPETGNASESDKAKKRSCNEEASNDGEDPPANKKQKTSTTPTRMDRSGEAQWMKLYRMAIAFGKVHGHYDIPTESTNAVHVQLRSWIEQLQAQYEDILHGKGPDLVQKLLTKTRITKLTRLNFPFQPGTMQSSTSSPSASWLLGSPNSQARQDKNFLQEHWMKFFRLAIAYKKKNGTFDIPSNATNPEDLELRKWMQWQRVNYRHFMVEGKTPPNKSMTEARIRELQKIGFPWEGAEDETTTTTTTATVSTNEKLRKRKPHPNWMVMYFKLKEYYETNQTFTIPALPTTTTGGQGQSTVSEEDKAREELRLWLKEQNNEYANLKENLRSTMTADKIELLAAIGYEFHYVTFAEYLEQLKTYIQENGTREIPESHPLSKWAKKVKGQMKRLAEGKPGVKLSEAEAQQLQDLGFFPGNIRTPVNKEEEDRKWEEMYEKMKEYKKEHGDCLISTTNWQDPLVKWTVTQRRHYKTIAKKGSCVHLDARKLQKLHEIGFVFKQVNGGYKSFAERLEELREFKAKHGHLRVPTNQAGTGGFVAYCRDQYRLAEKGEKHSMTEEKFQVLREMGFEFQVGKSNPRTYSQHTWDERFQQLLQYKEKYGNTVVPQHFTGFNNLGQWVKTQRDYYRSLRKGQKSPMTTEQALKLNDIGFVWDAQAYKRKKAAGDRNDDSDGDYEEGTERQASLPAMTTPNKLPDLRDEGRKNGQDGESSDDDAVGAPPRFYDTYY